MAGAPPFEIRDRAVYLPEPDALALADLHLGRDAASNVAFPLGERGAIAGRVDALLARFEPAAVVLVGDVLHSFSTVPEGVPEALGRLRDLAADAGADLTIVRGNHDTMLASVADPVDEHRLPDGTVACHGHEAPSADADRYVIGHQHPAIDIEGRRRPCVLYGEAAYRGADVIVLPAFTELAPGTEVNGLRGADADSPLLSNLDAFRPIVHDGQADETFAFPPLGSLREFL